MIGKEGVEIGGGDDRVRGVEIGGGDDRVRGNGD